MTAVAQRTPNPRAAASTATTDLRRALGAELVRARRSPAALLPLVGIVVCAMSGAGRLAVSGTGGGWTGLLSWHTLYVTGLSAVLVALLAGLTERRDRGSRSGGTPWRPVRPVAVRGARLLVLAGLSLVLNLLVFLPYVPLGLVLGLRDAPVGPLAGAAVLVWATGLGWLVLACAIARWTGPFPVLGLSLLWQAAGAVQAESSLWWALPWTWSVRPVLPLVGVHHNGVSLEPGSPVWDYPAWPSLLASALLAAAALPAYLADDGRGGTSRALLGSLRRTAIGPLTLAVAVLLALVAAVRPSYLEGLLGFVVLPTGAWVLAVLAWQAQAPAWRIVATRDHRPHRAGRALLGVLAGIVTGTCAFAGLLMVLIGDDAGYVASRVAVGVSVGWAIVALTLWLYTRFHLAVALTVNVLGGMTGVLFGGSTLAASWLWLAGPSGWMLSATGPTRTAVAITLSLGVAAATSMAWLRASTR
ncbi:MAG: hypothetical protein L0I76_09660 [Pseudonocardia sp.]|nr:hypothetical protein [Pseudonocardia sp.]